MKLNIALCYESVFPAKGGAETYLCDLSRNLVADSHEVHLYCCRWDDKSLPSSLIVHQLPASSGWRFLRPWKFGQACLQALQGQHHDVTVGFDKTWGLDVLYPQGGLHAASQYHNRLKFRTMPERLVADLGKCFDPAAWSFRWLEHRQYLARQAPVIIVNSQMVQRHFQQFYGVGPDQLRMIHSAIDPKRFESTHREQERLAERQLWGIPPNHSVGLMVAMNYRLKGLEPLIRAAVNLPRDSLVTLAIVGHPNTRRYERLAKSLGVADRFRFLGFRADPRTAYFAADFLVHPTFYDPCSLVVLEALACGLPVITSRYNGASELLKIPDCGLVIQDPHDAKELSRALIQMTISDYRRSASLAALEAAQRWTFDDHCRALVNVFYEVRHRKRLQRVV